MRIHLKRKNKVQKNTTTFKNTSQMRTHTKPYEFQKINHNKIIQSRKKKTKIGQLFTTPIFMSELIGDSVFALRTWPQSLPR